jgi:hypothetical protein
MRVAISVKSELESRLLSTLMYSSRERSESEARMCSAIWSEASGTVMIGEITAENG